MQQNQERDGLQQALADRWAYALRDYAGTLPQAVDAPIYQAAGATRTTLMRWGASGMIDTAVLLRLDAFFAAEGKTGFMEAVLERPALAMARWSAESVDLSHLKSKPMRALIAAAKAKGGAAHPMEALQATGLLAKSHVILLRDTDAISTHIGSATVVSPDLLGRDIRDRANRDYAALVHAQVRDAAGGATIHRLRDSQGNQYQTLRVPFRPKAAKGGALGGPVQIVAVPFDIHSVAGYLVR